MNTDTFDISEMMLQLFDNTAESIAVLDPSGRILYANQITAVYCRKTIEEMQGNLLWELVPEVIGSQYEAGFRRAVREQIPVAIENYFPPTDKWFEVRFYPSANVVAIFGADITDRKTGSEAIRQERERLQNTLNAAGIGTWRWSFADNFYITDAKTREFFDLTPEQIDVHDGSAYFNRIHPDDMPLVEAVMKRATEEGEGYNITYRVVAPDQPMRWIDSRGQLEYDREGRLVALIGTVMDVTAQKEAEEYMRVSEERYRVLIASMDQGFSLIEMIYDENDVGVDYLFHEVNPIFEQMTGLKDVIGKRVREVVPDLEDFWAQRYGEVARTGQAMRFQHGSVALGRMYDVFTSSLDGNRVAILFTDITERVRRERETEALNERLRRSMQETHHRVKNNLQVIAALVDMQAADLENEAAAPLNRINQHIQALAVLHDLLTHQAKTDVDMEHIGIRAILNTLLPLLKNTVGERGIVASSDDVILTAQKAASFALLVNECVSNAVKHASAGQIEITVKRQGDTAILEICDDGTGFPADFDPRKAANTGLQLIESTARWDLGGDVKYDNHGLGGGRVMVTFPLDLPSA